VVLFDGIGGGRSAEAGCRKQENTRSRKALEDLVLVTAVETTASFTWRARRV
jgi:hypothetical protein